MKQRKPFPDPAAVQPMMDEVDIGSGEKTPGEHETEEYVMGIAADSDNSPTGQAEERQGRDGQEENDGPGPAIRPAEQQGRDMPAARPG